MATNAVVTDVDDDGFYAGDDRYDTLILPPDVQQAIDQVRLFLNVTIVILFVYRYYQVQTK
jgi:hypothetical protein